MAKINNKISYRTLPNAKDPEVKSITIYYNLSLRWLRIASRELDLIVAYLMDLLMFNFKWTVTTKLLEVRVRNMNEISQTFAY